MQKKRNRLQFQNTDECTQQKVGEQKDGKHEPQIAVPLSTLWSPKVGYLKYGYKSST